MSIYIQSLLNSFYFEISSDSLCHSCVGLPDLLGVKWLKKAAVKRQNRLDACLWQSNADGRFWDTSGTLVGHPQAAVGCCWCVYSHWLQWPAQPFRSMVVPHPVRPQCYRWLQLTGTAGYHLCCGDTKSEQVTRQDPDRRQWEEDARPCQDTLKECPVRQNWNYECAMPENGTRL